jgi:hypothetical protein
MKASLAALLRNLIDYAGLYPPAALPLPRVVENYETYRRGPYSWMLNRLVLPLEKLAEVRVRDDWRVTLLVAEEPGPLAPQVETLETKGTRRLSLPTYCEAPPAAIENAFAKIRTAGAGTGQVEKFLAGTASRRMPFKATAGLHHPVRGEEPGFINVFVAAAFAWHGQLAPLIYVLEERDAAAFEWEDDRLTWRGTPLTVGEIETARREYAHSFGSCSFDEPVEGLRELGWLE